MQALVVQDLKKSYRAPDGSLTRVIDVPSLTLEEGEQAALEGGSGTGKTTLLNLIAGILKPDSGSVTVAGVETSALSEADRDRARAASLGYIFQTFNLLQGMTALENVALGMAFGRGADLGHARELLVRVGLKDRLDHRPSQLSVGQQQRVAVARAIVHRPALVLADEPTANLDSKTGAALLDLMQSLNAEHGVTFLFSSHDPAVLSRARRVVHLQDGELHGEERR